MSTPSSMIAKKVLLGIGLMAIAASSRAQLVVTPQTNLEALAQSIAGPGVRIANPVMNCHPSGYGEFTYTGSLLDVTEGILLTSGTINNAVGPNNAGNRTFEQNRPGDALLNTVTGRTTYDACRFEFDVIPGGDSLSFDFVFGSEEYNEWVGSQFNDVFGFFISGPGIAGDPGIGNDHNIALVPNTTQAVTINNVNAASNSNYYFYNSGGSQVQYDGITRQLKAVSPVEPCQTYHLKLTVADASDRKLDSGVLIARIESNAVTMSAFTQNGMPNMVEGCNPGTLRFTRSSVSDQPMDVSYFLAGTTINGTDYPLIGSTADPLIAKTVTIPAFEASADVAIDPILDGIVEGTEELKVYLGISACPNYYADSLSIGIQDDLSATINNPSSICSGGSTQLSATGGYSYQWAPTTGLNSTNIANPVATPSNTTSYSVLVEAGGCSSTLNTTVSVSNIALNASLTQPLCNGSTNGIINLSVSGGIAPYSFAWTGPNGFTSSDEDLTGIVAGTYTVTVNDGANCTKVQSFNVNQPQPMSVVLSPSILAFGQNIACNGGSTGSINLTISGGTGPYATAWTGPNGFTSTLMNLTGLRAGAYTVVVTDANGCTTSGSFPMSEPDALVASIDVLQSISCAGDADAVLEASIAGGMPLFTYNWNTSPAQTAATATGLGAGTYAVTITDGYGCSTQTTATISAPAPLGVDISNIINLRDCQNTPLENGSATASAVGGTGPYAYAWNTVPEQQNATASFAIGGNYTATVTDANGCTAIASTTIAQATEPTAAITATSNTTCFGNNIGSATIAITGGTSVNTIVWNSTPAQTGATLTGVAAGLYTATATHADGCTTTIDATIAGPSADLVATIDPNVLNVSCAGNPIGSATVIASGGGAPYTYAWNTSPAQTTATATDLAVGNWTVTVTDAFGCTAQATAAIGGPTTLLTVQIISYQNILCSGAAQGEATAAATGGTAPYTYAWNTPLQQTGATATSLPEGTYTVTATDANGCSATANVTILGPDEGLESVVESYGNVSCFGGNDGFATIQTTGGSGSYSYLWNTVPPQTGATATGLGVGTYIVEITDNNGCDSTKYLPVAISGPASPLAIGLNVTPILCGDVEDGAADVTVTGGQAPYTYQWTDSFGNSTGLEDVSGLGAGDYFLNVFDAFGCSLDTSFSLTEPEPLSVQTTVSAVPCQGSTTGSITAVENGGTGSISFDWTGPNGYTANTSTISNLAAGDYTLTLTDDNGCQLVRTYTIVVSAPPQLSAVLSSNNGTAISCSGGSDGNIDLIISGGQAPFTIAWTDGLGFISIDEDLNDLPAGAYQVTVTDQLGCNADTLFVLSAPQPIGTSAVLSTINGNNIGCAGATTGGIDLTVTGGTAPFTYLWNDGSTSEDLTNASAGNATVTITDANGCTATGNWTLTEPAPLTAVATALLLPNGYGVSCAGVSDGSITTNITGGTTAYSIAWTGPNGFTGTAANLSGLAAGTYQATVTDANGCIATAGATITAPTPLNTQLIASIYNAGVNISCAGAANGSVVASAQGGVPTYQFDWSGPGGFTSNDSFLQSLAAGTYDLLVTDANGCTATQSITLSEPQPLSTNLTISDAGNGLQVGCSGNDGSIDLDVSGGVQPYSIGWSGPDGSASTTEDLQDLVPGTYVLEVMDANGCVAEETVVLTGPSAIGFTTNVTNNDCSGLPVASIDLTLTAGEAPLTVEWNGPNGFTATSEDIAQLANGTYTATITDAVGCTVTNSTTIIGPEALTTGAYLSFFGQYNLQCVGDSSGTFELEPQGGTAPFTIAVNGPNGYSATGTDHVHLVAGNYQVNIVDALGCSMDTTVVLTEPITVLDASLNVSIYPSGTNISCHGASDGWIDATINGGIGPFSFLWRGPDSTEFNTEDITGLPAGNYAYELVVTDANQCSFFTDVVLTEPASALSTTFALSDHNGSNVSCAGSNDGSIDASIAGGSPSYNFTWTGPTGTISSTEDISGLAAGDYTFTVVDTNGCVLVSTVTLMAPEPVSISLLAATQPSGTNISCNGINDGSINPTIAGGTAPYTLTWTGPNGFTASTEQINGLYAGAYCLQIEDANGCATQTCITLSEPAPLAATATTTTADCGSNTGGVDLSVTGGSAPYQYTWSNGATSQDLSNSAPATYSVTVVDANGCTTELSATILGTPGTSITGTIIDNLCNGASDGAIDVEMTSGTAPFSYAWSNGGTSQDLSQLSAGSYTLTVSDANGCTASDTWTVQESAAITVDTTLSAYDGGYNVSENGASDGSAMLNIAGGTAPYTVVWSNGSTGPALNGISAGSYTATITDANGCTVRTTITIKQPEDVTLPTGYTPNGDGYNDFFVVRGLDAFPNNTFTVFNRWGNVVFDTFNYKNDWAGQNTTGDELPNGTYFVIITLKGGERTLQGYVDLRR